MPDEDSNNKYYNFDKEYSPNTQPQPNSTEHADLDHRLQADAEHTKVTAPPLQTQEPVAQPAPIAPAPVAPAPVPVQPATPAGDSTLPNASPGIMVLQWLTYAFWGWTLFSLSGLILLVVNQLMAKMNDNAGGAVDFFGGGIAYLLAAVLVLYVIALTCDIFYARAEKRYARSTGTNVIMIIHAVIFALYGIGALIMSVFGIVSLLIGDSKETSSVVSTVISGGIIALLYGITLLRTLRPRWIKNVVKMYWISMTLAIIIAVTLGVVGPAANARLQRQDAVIEQGLPTIADEINDFANDNSTLPASLGDIESSVSSQQYNTEAQELLSNNLVRYTPGAQVANSNAVFNNFNNRSRNIQAGESVPASYAYKLCVTYKTSDDASYGSKPYVPDGQKYPTTLQTGGHKAGEVCYDLQTGNAY